MKLIIGSIFSRMGIIFTLMKWIAQFSQHSQPKQPLPFPCIQDTKAGTESYGSVGKSQVNNSLTDQPKPTKLFLAR